MSIDKLTSQIQATEVAWNRLQDNRKREWGLYGHDMGIHPLNLQVGGWIPSKVTTIGARSGIGKTAMTAEMFKAGARVSNGRRAEFLFFTWEMEPSFLVDRHICNVTGITNNMLNQGAKLLGDNTMGKIKDAYTGASKLPVRYQEMSTNFNEVAKLSTEFVERCAEMEQVEGLKIQPVIIVDFIGMAKFEGSGLRTYGIADFMTGCKQLANRTGASFCIFAQINRGADEKQVPQRADFSDSQSIENASDNLILLHRPEYNNVAVIKDPSSGEELDAKNKMLIRVLKGRDYGTGDSIISCDIKYFRFHDLEHEYGYEYWKLYNDENFWLKHYNLI